MDGLCVRRVEQLVEGLDVRQAGIDLPVQISVLAFLEHRRLPRFLQKPLESGRGCPPLSHQLCCSVGLQQAEGPACPTSFCTPAAAPLLLPGQPVFWESTVLRAWESVSLIDNGHRVILQPSRQFIQCKRRHADKRETQKASLLGRPGVGHRTSRSPRMPP